MRAKIDPKRGQKLTKSGLKQMSKKGKEKTKRTKKELKGLKVD